MAERFLSYSRPFGLEARNQQFFFRVPRSRSERSRSYRLFFSYLFQGRRLEVAKVPKANSPERLTRYILGF